uniref:Uncharacterized protein n=1 Tax=Octopus bimaculoides TaxID=37653 RepID=A0A0L8HRN8_OCTBM
MTARFHRIVDTNFPSEHDVAEQELLSTSELLLNKTFFSQIVLFLQLCLFDKKRNLRFPYFKNR